MRLGALVGDLTQAEFEGHPEYARPELAFLGKQILHQLSGDTGFLPDLDDALIELVLPLFEHRAGFFQPASIGIAIGQHPSVRAVGYIHQALNNQPASQIIIWLFGCKQLEMVGGGQPGRRVAQLAGKLPRCRRSWPAGHPATGC